MQPKLSIIIPCYNCQDTLEEAVDSCYVQGLTEPFEIVMVDDKSTDRTREIMKELSEKYKEIKLFYHEENKGGGATRNTAVAKTTGEIIFCLDSDDVLPLEMLPKMLRLMEEKSCDGITFEETRFFKNNKDRTEIVKNNSGIDSPIQIEDLFQGKGFLTQVNFMYTKDSFYKTGRYPENHGFDTQDFGFRFLAKEQKAYVCPNTYYLHRRMQKQKSYFERVYEGGDLSLNMYLIYENILDILTDKAINIIVNYNIFQKASLGENNLRSELEKMPANEIIIGDNRKNLKKDEVKVEDNFRLAVNYYKNGNYPEALDSYKKILEKGLVSQVIIFNIIRCSLSISRTPSSNIEKKAKELLLSMSPEKQRGPDFIRKICRHLSKLVKRNKK